MVNSEGNSNYKLVFSPEVSDLRAEERVGEWSGR